MRWVLWFILSLSIAHGQELSLGATTGALLADPVKEDAQNRSNANRFVIGTFARLYLHSGFGIQAGALRTELLKVDYRFGHTGFGTTRATISANSWQFPFLLQYSPTRARFAPFFGGGVSFRRASDEQNEGENCSSIPTVVCRPFFRDTPPERRITKGAVAGAGLDVALGPLRFSPEFRWTRWFSTPFFSPVTADNQFDVLLHIGVRVLPIKN